MRAKKWTESTPAKTYTRQKASFTIHQIIDIALIDNLYGKTNPLRRYGSYAQSSSPSSLYTNLPLSETVQYQHDML